ncbi:MAG: hypothetical protein DMG57_18120 [Acidobacteria bacterium]|nr:MAG: hypothetical protein DMG57_18120 [Acidobacteriota bacterium]
MRVAILSLVVLILIGCQGYHYDTPLTRAAATGTPADVTRTLRGASPDEIQTALIAASRAGNAAAIPILANAGADVTRPWGANSWTPLEHAVHKRQAGSITGAPVDQRDEHQRTALRWAAGNGFTEIAQLLMERGADPHIADEDDVNALDAAIYGLPDLDNFTAGSCQTETVRAILAKAPDLTPSEKRWNRIATKLKQCRDIERLIATKY